jgi:hypothetical protein
MIRFVWAVGLALLVSGCIHQPIDTAGPSYQTVKLIRDAQLPPMALGDFGIAGDPAIGSRSIAIRGSTMRPPKGGTFATFLKETIQSQLVAAGCYDPGAPVRVAAQLTQNTAGENMASGKAVLAARFTVTRDLKPVFERVYEVENRWKSEFIGAIAIPEAFAQYNALYGQLVTKVLSDPEFAAALKAPA